MTIRPRSLSQVRRNIDLDAADLVPRLATAFHDRHEELYTYALRDQEAVLVNARVAVIGELPALPQEPDLALRAVAVPRFDQNRNRASETA